MTLTRFVLTGVLLSVAATTSPAQLAQTLPSGFTNTLGGAATGLPLNTNSSQKWQWHYDSSQVQVVGAIIITEIAVRCDDPGATVNAFSFNNFTVTLASSPTNYSSSSGGGAPGHSNVFANNLNPDATVVRSGPWTGGPVGPSGATTATWIPFGLTAPFIYDPTIGNDFVIQIEKCGSTTSWGANLDTVMGSPGTVLGNRYGHTSNCASNTSNLAGNETVPIVRITYSQGGLLANFSGTPLSGNAPLTVQFTDQSVSSSPGGVTSWSWDFTGDGIPDSTVQNPSWTFPPGTHNVALTVMDGVNAPSSTTKQNYVTVGPYQLAVFTSGAGTGDLLIIPPFASANMTEGFLFVSASLPNPVGSGPFLGLGWDSNVQFSLLQPAGVGSIFHWIPTPGLFPFVNLNAPPGSVANLAGMTFDLCTAYIIGGISVEASNVVRITI